MRVVVDTSVWVSALISTIGAPTQVVTAMVTGRIIVVASPHLLEELSDVLNREKFRSWFSVEDGGEFVTQLAHRVELRPDVNNPTAATRDKDDDYLVALAYAYNARLVSVDKDLLDANLNPKALSPRELLQLLREQ
ncbi:MAG: putative toxin-antitoxin system toxin component, PIN family [Acidimicrobiales bacterium]|nr:MAG: putative toxin-antitoxin system toxin component, PIN family [Acidimicrobiales bacterium]